MGSRGAHCCQRCTRPSICVQGGISPSTLPDFTVRREGVLLSFWLPKSDNCTSSFACCHVNLINSHSCAFLDSGSEIVFLQRVFTALNVSAERLTYGFREQLNYAI